MTPSAGTGGTCFFRHAHAASGFSQEGQMRPDSVEYTRLESVTSGKAGGLKL